MINIYQPTLGKEELDALQKVLSLTGLEKVSELLSLRKNMPSILAHRKIWC